MDSSALLHIGPTPTRKFVWDSSRLEWLLPTAELSKILARCLWKRLAGQSTLPSYHLSTLSAPFRYSIKALRPWQASCETFYLLPRSTHQIGLAIRRPPKSNRRPTAMQEKVENCLFPAFQVVPVIRWLRLPCMTAMKSRGFFGVGPAYIHPHSGLSFAAHGAHDVVSLLERVGVPPRPNSHHQLARLGLPA